MTKQPHVGAHESRANPGFNSSLVSAMISSRFRVQGLGCNSRRLDGERFFLLEVEICRLKVQGLRSRVLGTSMRYRD